MKKSIILLFLLSACASAGVKVDQSKLSEFHRGQTTYSEVVEKLGKPSQVMVDANGNKAVMYIYTSAQARPESFIPVVGAFVGGVDTENSVVSLNFNNKDILVNYASNQGGTGVGTGFEAQSQPINYSQPRQVQ